MTVEGDWEKITDFCEQLNYNLEIEKGEEDLGFKDLESWKDWQPNRDDDKGSINEFRVDRVADELENPP